MSRLPRISGRECIKALQKVGFYQKHQVGSHIVMRRDQPYVQTVVTDHRELDRGTLRAIVRQSSLSVEEFINLL